MDTVAAPHPSAPTLADYVGHSPFSDPGPYAGLLVALGTDPSALRRAATRAILHYRAQAERLTPEQMPDIDARYVREILHRAADRDPGPLDASRPDTCAVAGCCRDRALLAVAALREGGVPARSRLGFTGAFAGGYRYGHVVAERWDGSRWVRFDPGLDPAGSSFDVDDLPTGEGAPFETAAEVWLAYRAGRDDLSSTGVSPELPELGGSSIVQRYVLADVAHRHRCETILWDAWGAMVPPGAEPDDGQLALTDELARLTMAADGDPDPTGRAATALAALWAGDPRVNPAGRVLSFVPLEPGLVPRVVGLPTAVQRRPEPR